MRYRSIQVLRGLAAAMVVAGHLFRTPLGIAGVDIFFVISGFIIASIAPQEGALRFLVKRCIRIYPMYWLCLIPAIFLATGHEEIGWPRMLASLTLLPVGQATAPYLIVGWSLMFEILFYVAVAISVSRRSATLILAAFVLAFFLNAVSTGPVIGFLGHPLILEFLAGVAIVLLPRSTAIGFFSLILGIGLFALHSGTEVDFPWSFTEQGSQMHRVCVFGIPAALTVYGCLALEGMFEYSAWLPLVALGDASYSLYLTHLGVINVPGWKPALFVAAVLVGLIVHRRIERPMTAALNARLAPKSGSKRRPAPLLTA